MSADGREVPTVRTGQGSTKLSREEFERRYRAQFYHPAFEVAKKEIDRLTDIAWKNYEEGDKAPRTREAGGEFANPKHEVSIEWLATRDRIKEAQLEFERGDTQARILLICASPRTDETCPSEMSKTFRMAKLAKECFENQGGFSVDFLDLSQIVSEYGHNIFPCKACVSTAMPLCHWPCSCYPNHYMGQVHDWMNEIYPRWVAAHGVMIITPVHWYQAPSVLKLMMDRLVCADGGNPDPTTTDGKDAAKAKALELQGWPFPKHLAGRIFSVIVHGDAEGAEILKRNLHDWLTDMALVPAGPQAVFDRYIGYYEAYATSHDALDRDEAFQQEVRNAACVLVEAVVEMRQGRKVPGADIASPRQK